MKIPSGKEIYGIKESELNQIKNIFKRYKKIDEVILFGSRAKGNYQQGSDIDLALKGKEINLDDILNLYIDTEELDLPYVIDLVIYDRVKENALTEHIDRAGIVLYRRSDKINFY